MKRDNVFLKGPEIIIPAKGTGGSLVFGGKLPGQSGPPIKLNSNIVVAKFPGAQFQPELKNDNAPLVFTSKDGTAQQWCILVQMEPADIVAGNYGGIAIQQEFNGAKSWVACGIDPATGNPLIFPSVTSFPIGTVGRMGSLFRAYGDKVKIFPYAQQAASVSLNVQCAQIDLTSFSQNTRHDTGIGGLPVPWYATHIAVNTIAGALNIRDSAAALLDSIVAPVAGTYYLLPPNAASVINSGAVGNYVFSYRIFG